MPNCRIKGVADFIRALLAVKNHHTQTIKKAPEDFLWSFFVRFSNLLTIKLLILYLLKGTFHLPDTQKHRRNKIKTGSL
jgi:hypothetical protein